MSAALGDFGGTFTGAPTAGDGAGLGLEATEELSQPAAASAKAAANNRFALLLMTIPLGNLRSESDIRAGIMATNSRLFPKTSEKARGEERNRRDTIRSGTSHRRSEFWRGQPCHRARGRGDY